MIQISELVLVSRPLVVLVGPTAVGKSAIGLQLARSLDTEILTADSRQVYRGMDVATDKPTLEERAGVAHRLIDVVDPDESFNAGDYRRLALQDIERLYGESRLPLVVGGTGLYVRTLIHGLCDAPPADQAYRASLLEAAKTHGRHFLHGELTRIDPESARGFIPMTKSRSCEPLKCITYQGVACLSCSGSIGFRSDPSLLFRFDLGSRLSLPKNR